ncbi:MAG TPA: 6,7-dimethyl-8-ribityllumazine synthase [Thermoanaerobaculia bacterium]|nr:6,7-dimethyl-8-ribityllumazine synthase [Thermoanaerobaculia bacterium]
MNGIEETRGDLAGSGRRFGIVASRFNQRLGEALIAGAADCLRRHGVAAGDVLLVTVPGAWEIPQALAALASAHEAGRGVPGRPLDALIALGVVIRGETPHFDYLARECTAGIARAAERHGLPVAYGVLTCDTTEQAAERAGGKAGNKGWEAALAALEMADLFARLRAPSAPRSRQAARAPRAPRAPRA